MKIMKLTDVGSADHEVEPFITDLDWVMEQKFDGTRLQMIWDLITGEIMWSNDGVGPIKFSAAKLKLPALEMQMRTWLDPHIFDGRVGLSGRVILEGELIIESGIYHMFDLISEDPNASWRSRRSKLENLAHNQLETLPLMELTYVARTVEDKRSLWERVNAGGVEGAVSKHVNSIYVPGERTKEWVKHKLVKSADLVVLSAERLFKPGTQVVHKGSAELAYVTADGSLQRICSASLIGRDLTIAPGDVVEIEYLYREAGGAPVQPRITRKRWNAVAGDGDKRPEDCTEDQFPEYSRSAV